MTGLSVHGRLRVVWDQVVKPGQMVSEAALLKMANLEDTYDNRRELGRFIGFRRKERRAERVYVKTAL
jgi:hypothetical protein